MVTAQPNLILLQIAAGSCGLRIANGHAAQQLADLRLAGAAIGAGLKAPADVLDAGCPFEDFGRDLVLPDAEA